MDKTNLLRVLENQSGEFFLFSQYSNDLTKEMSQMMHYKVEPSKFACLELAPDADTNKNWPTFLQNYYENACTFLRSKSDTQEAQGYSWKVFDASYLLWDTLLSYKLINLGQGNICEELRYIGDINIISNNYDGGVNYNEIYCYIPAEAGEYQYEFNFLNETPIHISYDVEYQGTPTLVGWDSDNYPTNAPIPNRPFDEGMDQIPNEIIAYSDRWCYPTQLGRVGSAPIDPILQNNDSFKFNTVILFYDIKKWDEERREYITIEKNLPLGIYFAGIAEDPGSGFKFTNEVTKFVSSDDIYGQGTSYGLRVVTKYISQANATWFYAEAGADQDNPYPEYAQAMGQMAEVLQNLQDMIGQSGVTQEMKNHINIIRNYRTNVPYILLVGGERHWFVNGRDLGPVDAGSSSDYRDVTINSPLNGNLDVQEQTQTLPVNFNLIQE